MQTDSADFIRLVPFLFGSAIGEFVLDLYVHVYSSIYLPIGLPAILETHSKKRYY